MRAGAVDRELGKLREYLDKEVRPETVKKWQSFCARPQTAWQISRAIG